MGTTFGCGFLREDIHGVPNNDAEQNPDEFRGISEEGWRRRRKGGNFQRLGRLPFLLVMYERERQECGKDDDDAGLDQTNIEKFCCFPILNNRWNGISKWILIAIRALILKQCHPREKYGQLFILGFCVLIHKKFRVGQLLYGGFDYGQISQ